MEHDYKIPPEGCIFRNKSNPDDFSSALYIGEGRTIDEWEEVPISIYDEWQKEAAEKSRAEMGMPHIG